MIFTAFYDRRGKIYLERNKTVYTAKKALEKWPKLRDEMVELRQNLQKAPYVRVTI